MTREYRFVQPVDTLSIRGNKLFGDPGSFGESSFPPRPSVLAGAFRSMLLAGASNEIEKFAANGRLSDKELDRILGTPEQPGDFTLTGLFPARRDRDGKIDLFLSLPADVLVSDQGTKVRQLEPQALPDGVQAGGEGLPFIAMLRQSEPSKPEGDWLLNQAGLTAYLRGESLQSGHLEKLSGLLAREARIGVGIERDSRTAEEGKLFTVEHSMTVQPEHPKERNGKPAEVTTGLAVGLAGCGGRLPREGFLRLGGDGRAAYFSSMPPPKFDTPLERIEACRRFKLVLVTPGLFEQGWLPDGVSKEGETFRLKLHGLSARLACAAVARFEVISGWDLAKWSPKPAERVAPAGSVYWFDELQDDLNMLGKLAEQGWWPDSVDNERTARRAQGFNNVFIAAWPREEK